MKDSLYSITQVSDITGVNSVTLRAWERRYGLIKPQRDAKGHRFYTDDNVEEIKKILSWLDRGVAISKVKDILKNEDAKSVDVDVEEHWLDNIEKALGFIADFKSGALQGLINELTALYPVESLIDEFFAPLDDALIAQYRHQYGGAAHLSFYRHTVSNLVLSRIQRNNENSKQEKIILFVLEGEGDMLPSSLFALSLSSKNYRVQIIGPNCPLEELIYIAEKVDACAAVCCSDKQQSSETVAQVINKVQKQARLPVFLHGKWVDLHPQLNEFADNVLGSSAKASTRKLMVHLVSEGD